VLIDNRAVILGIHSAVIAGLGVAAYWFAMATWSILTPPETARFTQTLSAQIAPESTTIAKAQVPQKVALLFGKEPPKAIPRQVVVPPKPEVKPVPTPVIKKSLKLKLQGVFASSDPLKGSAVIANPTGVAESFRVGADLYGIATLEAVYPDRVVVNFDGEPTTMTFETVSQASDIPTASPPVNQYNDTNSAGPIVRQPSSMFVANPSLREPSALVATPGAASRRTDEAQNPQAIVERLKQQAMESPESMVQQYGLQATPDGYIVTPAARDLLFLGMRPGDMIVSVNDMSVGDPIRDSGLIEQVMASEEVKIEIKRGSRVFAIYQSIPRF